MFGLIAGQGFFQRYGSFTGKEFVEFLKDAGKTWITDGAPAQVDVRDGDRAPGRGAAVLHPAASELEEVWRQMKHAILDVP